MSYHLAFDQVAALYDEIRPGYPKEIIEAIIAWSALPTTGRILEVGPGTGQITRPFAERGYQVLGLEPGPRLAAFARGNCHAYPAVDFLTTTFEDWPLQARAFDLVLSAQAFHWIAPEFGLSKAAGALKAAGSLALVWHTDASAETPFYRASTPIFERHVSDDPERSIPPSSLQIYEQALSQSELFQMPLKHMVSWQEVYSKTAFIKLLNTFSPHILLAEEARARLNHEISELIDDFGGSVTRHYQTHLILAKLA
jgi:SAM-dependent methyltransferase